MSVLDASAGILDGVFGGTTLLTCAAAAHVAPSAGDGSAKSFEITAKATAEEVVARVMMAARDPADDDSAEAGAAAGAGAAAPAGVARGSAPFAGGAAAAAGSAASAAHARAFSTLAARRPESDGSEWKQPQATRDAAPLR